MDNIQIGDLDESLFYLFSMAAMLVLTTTIRQLDHNITSMRKTRSLSDASSQTDMELETEMELIDMSKSINEESVSTPVVERRKKAHWLW